ncbi:hypothetical protein L5515_005093 [Caenorhabditis briggsae]|uniref:Sdz-33 F-box domain-containing protein n=1 Tax=Caenorhabditis briggsae TaxID=6238 RepID=A0AAE9ENR1_CAEBR|nr:hypothetical protein L5515_005093 [Caenorhabditis briggsae]
MAKHKFPIQRLPDGLGLMVLNTMEHHEIMAFSFTSKKSLSMFKALRLPVHHVKLAFPNEIAVLFDRVYYSFYLKRHGNDDQIRSLNDLPASVDIRATSLGNIGRLTWSNQGKTIGEWIHHFCSISKPETRYQVSIETERMRFEIHSLRNTFPKLRKITIYCSQDESNENCLSSSETCLRAFLPNLESLVLYGLPPNLPIGIIGMTNLKALELYHDHSPLELKTEDFLSLNVRSCIIKVNEFSLRDLNRFFKKWIKGSNPRLKDLHIYGYLSGFPDWKLLLKGLKAVEKDEEEEVVEDESDESEEEVSEEEEEAGEADEPQVEKEEADDEDEEESEREDEADGADDAQEERLEEEKAVEEPKDAQNEEGPVEEVEEEEDEEYEDEEPELDEDEEDEDEMEEAHIAPVARRARREQDEEEPEEIPLEEREGAENADVVKKYIIRNCLGVCAEIETEFNINFYVTASVNFTVKK